MLCRSIVDLAFPHWTRVASALLCGIALTACEVAALAATAPTSDSSAQESGAPLRVALVVDGPVSKWTVRTMQAEAERIWGPYGVQIQWLAHGRWMGSDVDLVALVGES